MGRQRELPESIRRTGIRFLQDEIPSAELQRTMCEGRRVQMGKKSLRTYILVSLSEVRCLHFGRKM